MSMQDTIRRSGIKQKFLADKFGVSETLISALLKNEDVFRRLEAYVKQVEELR